jgi:IS5 family transposase
MSNWASKGDGTTVDATLIPAPPTTENKEREREADMHQTKKTNQR